MGRSNELLARVAFVLERLVISLCIFGVILAWLLILGCGAHARVDHEMPLSTPAVVPPASLYVPPAGEPMYCFPGRAADDGEHLAFCAKTEARCEAARTLAVDHAGGQVSTVGDCDYARLW